MVAKASLPLWPFVGIVLGVVAVLGYFGARVLIASAERTPVFTTQPEPPRPPPDADIREAVSKWNDAETAHDVTKLQAMYSDPVCFYHADYTPAQVANALHGLYASDPGFKQSIDPSSIDVLHRVPSGRVRVEFNKSFTSKGRTSTTHAYLVFDASHKIIVEGDDVTDANMRKTPTLGRCANAETW